MRSNKGIDGDMSKVIRTDNTALPCNCVVCWALQWTCAAIQKRSLN